MLTIAPSRLCALLALVVLWCSCGAGRAASDDPAGLVASIYANGHERAVWIQWLDAARRGTWFSVATTALWGRCDAIARKTKDQAGPLDFDVATNSQGAEVKRASIKVQSQGQARATVLATLTPDNWSRRSARENAIRYELVLERDGWKIDDIHGVAEPNAWSLRALLKFYLTQ